MLGVDMGPAQWEREMWGFLSGGSGVSQERPGATAVHATALEPQEGYDKIHEPRLFIPQVFTERLLCTQHCRSAVGGTKVEAEIRGTFTDDVGAEVLGCRMLAPGLGQVRTKAVGVRLKQGARGHSEAAL